MRKKTSNTLLTIASAAMAIAGLLLLMISIFGETKDYWTLINALADISLANLFNIIRIQRNRKDEKNSDGSQTDNDF